MELPDTASQAEFARLLGYRRSYVTGLKAAGRLVLAADGRVQVAESIARIEATRDPSKQAVADRHAAARDAAHAAQEPAPAQLAPSPSHSSEQIGSSYQAARAVKERYLALDAKRAYEEAFGQLLRADHVRATIVGIITALRGRIEALPDLIAAQVAAELDESRCRALIAEYVEQVLTDSAVALARVGVTEVTE